MTRSFLRASTAMVLALSLVQAPLPVLAQVDASDAVCADGSAPPCGEGQGTTGAGAVEGAGAAEGGAATDGGAVFVTPPAEGGGSVEGGLATPDSGEPPPPEAPAGEAAPSGEAPAGGEQPAAEAQPAEEQPAAEEPPAEEQPAAEEPPAGETAPEAAAPEAGAMTPPETAPEAAPETAPEAGAGTDAGTVGIDPGAPAPGDAGTVGLDPAMPAPEAGSADPGLAPADAGAPVLLPEDAPQGVGEAQPAPEPLAPEAAAPEVASPAPVAPEAAEAPAAGTAETAPAAGAATPQTVPLVVEGAEELEQQALQVLEALDLGGDPAAEGSAAPPAAAAAAVDDAAPAPQATATVETEITEADSRQSSEDFTTTASGAAREGRDRDRLSDFEKAALIGLGALAVGALLRNNDRVVANTGDRVVVQRGENDYYVLKDDDALLRQPGSRVRTETFQDGSTRTIVTREDGSRIITIRDAAGRVIRRVREDAAGNRVTLIDDTLDYAPVQMNLLPQPEPREVRLVGDDPLALRLAIERASAANVGRGFSLRQIREIEQVRKLVPEIMVENITFATGSAAIDPAQARTLLRLGDLMKALIDDNPAEMFLIEGHTDATGPASVNLALSDRRAESLALALTEYFGVPPENMIVQGYGESDLKIDTQEAEVRNRRVTVRRITPLLDQRLARN
ncbi:MAG: OmpA family protein [Rhodobacteraceae bacterium]|nr:OmpA family protein [Paracoccaceae bacterium]